MAVGQADHGHALDGDDKHEDRGGAAEARQEAAGEGSQHAPQGLGFRVWGLGFRV